ncbi:hypothetical protein C8Q74DRAFT_1362941 [Fomes fomentarius]|nr:hypothetical protein C8Q74DRAFT_1362941 [Fomes fomentarius]
MDAVQVSADSFISVVRLNNVFTLAALSILYYDYALTITSEIEYYWSPPSLSISFVLFVVNRYVGLFGPMPLFFEYLLDFSEHRYTSHSVFFFPSLSFI